MQRHVAANHWRGRCCWFLRRRVCALQSDDEIAFRYLVTQLDFEFLHHTVERRRYFHGRFVGLQRNERLFRRHFVAHLYRHFDDGDAFETADIRHQYFFNFCHVVLLDYTVVGFGLSALILYSLIARLTSLASSLPSSDNAFNAATAT